MDTSESWTLGAMGLRSCYSLIYFELLREGMYIASFCKLWNLLVFVNLKIMSDKHVYCSSTFITIVYDRFQKSAFKL